MAELETHPAPSPQLRSGIKRLATISAILGGALTATACGGSSSSPYSSSTVSEDVAVLNFALNLEYLECEFYSVAVTGKTIAQNGIAVSGTGTAGGTTGGVQVNFTDPTLASIAQQILADEYAHINFLRGVLGSQAIAKPAINLNGLGMTNSAATPNSTQASYLLLSRSFEDTGVSAYAGSANALSSKTVLQAAAQILATEAYHQGAIHMYIAQMNVATFALDSMDQPPPPTGTKYFPTDSNALTIARTPAQVVNIVKPFFPNGINGVIQS